MKMIITCELEFEIDFEKEVSENCVGHGETAKIDYKHKTIHVRDVFNRHGYDWSFEEFADEIAQDTFPATIPMDKYKVSYKLRD